MNSSHKTAEAHRLHNILPSLGSEDEEIDVRQQLAALWFHKLKIILATLIAIAIGLYYAYFVAVPMYPASAVVILETQQDQIIDLQSVATGLTGDSTEVNSELEVLRARTLMGKVVDKLDLVKDPEFNTDLQEPSKIQTYIQQAKSFLPKQTNQNVLSPEEEKQRVKDATVTELLSVVNISNVTNSLVFRISVLTTSGRKSALIADTIMEQYILNQIEVKFKATEQAAEWLSERVSVLKGDLQVAEAKVSEFSASTDLVSIEGLQALERQIKERRVRIDGAETALAEIESKLDLLQTAETREEQAQRANDLQLTRLLEQTGNNTSISANFDARFGVILANIQANQIRAKQQLATLQASEVELSQGLDLQGKDLIKLQQLSREAEATRVLYEYFLGRLNEISAQQGVQKPDSRILSHAVIPSNPSEPRKSLILVLAAILGMGVGVVFVLFREAGIDAFRTSTDLERTTGLRVLGEIPQMPVWARSKVLNYLRDKPTSNVVEAYRSVRTSLMLPAENGKPLQLIVMTSSIPGEGKTTNALALAEISSGLGKKVLLVEGDIRRQTLGLYFSDAPNTKGLLSVIDGEITLEEAAFRSENLTADILLCREAPRMNPADLFSSVKFQKFLETAREAYDIIIVDTPPVQAVPDARIIAKMADATLFTVKWGATKKSLVADCMRLFQNEGQSITGILLAQVDPKSGGKYGYYDGNATKDYSSSYHDN